MNVLLDTCVLSELRRPERSLAVQEAVRSLADDAKFISVMTIGEIIKGLNLLAEGRKKQELSRWLMATDKEFQDRLLPVDRDVVQIWAEVTARAQKKSIQIPVMDGLIAATAICHGLHVMTRNRRDFAATGVLIIDPWEAYN